jgi:integrase/recombinase XerD
MYPISNHLISNELIAFLVDRQARQLSPRTIQFYEDELHWFLKFCQSENDSTMEVIDAPLIRNYLIHLSYRRNKGGIHAAFRAIKAFLNWWQAEVDDPNYKNPITKITPPTLSKEPLPGIPIDHIRRLIASCNSHTELGQRDRAIFTILIDTGLRKEELVALNIGDIDFRIGAVHVHHGKGDKSRTVFMGPKARRELIRYLRFRPEYLPSSPLLENQAHSRLTGAGLRQILRRHAIIAHIPEPGLHDFRRTCAIECLRNGMDVITLMHLMGHTTTTVLLRYLKLIESDLQASHASSSPADNL